MTIYTYKVEMSVTVSVTAVDEVAARAAVGAMSIEQLILFGATGKGFDCKYELEEFHDEPPSAEIELSAWSSTTNTELACRLEWATAGKEFGL